jgi:hypothetical protein
VGARIAIKSLGDLALLGVIWVCVNLRPVREICVFASVVIVTDWFMLHTFFLTVSIEVSLFRILADLTRSYLSMLSV